MNNIITLPRYVKITPGVLKKIFSAMGNIIDFKIYGLGIA